MGDIEIKSILIVILGFSVGFFAILILNGCGAQSSSGDPSLNGQFEVSGNELTVYGSGLSSVESIEISESENRSAAKQESTKFDVKSKSDDKVVAMAPSDFEFDTTKTYSVALNGRRAVRTDILITVTGVASCVDDFVLIGKKGRGAFCIHKESYLVTMNFWDASEFCANNGARLCTAGEFYVACKQQSLSGSWYWVDGLTAAAGIAMGNTSCYNKSTLDDYSGKAKVRCCYN